MFSSKMSNLISKIPSLKELALTINADTKERDDYALTVDQNFQKQAMEVIEQEGIHNTLFIIDTGHSIPVGFRLFAAYGLPIIMAEDIKCLDEVIVNRLKGQCLSFAGEIQFTNTAITDSLGVMLECHADSFNPELLPKYNDLVSKGIKKVVLLDEIRLGSASIANCRIEPYLNELKKYALSVKRIGIDYRQSERASVSICEPTAPTFFNLNEIHGVSLFTLDRIHSSSLPYNRNRKIVYKESPVEKLDESAYAQSKNGKRYV